MLSNWEFLIGDWKGEVDENQLDEGNIKTTVSFTKTPSDKFITGYFESKNENGLVNSSVEYLFYDGAVKKFLRKSVFSYGFVNNEIELTSNEKEIVFSVVVEPNPPQFRGIKWRSFIKKLDNTHIEMGLLSSKEGEEYKVFNKSLFEKI